VTTSKKNGQAEEYEGHYCQHCKFCRFTVSVDYVLEDGWAVYHPTGWAGGTGPGGTGFIVLMSCDAAFQTAQFFGGGYGPYNLYFFCPCDV